MSDDTEASGQTHCPAAGYSRLIVAGYVQDRPL